MHLGSQLPVVKGPFKLCSKMNGGPTSLGFHKILEGNRDRKTGSSTAPPLDEQGTLACKMNTTEGDQWGQTTCLTTHLCYEALLKQRVTGLSCRTGMLHTSYSEALLADC